MGVTQQLVAAVRAAIDRRAELDWLAAAAATRAWERLAGLTASAPGAEPPIADWDDALAEVGFRFRLTNLDVGLLAVAMLAEGSPAGHLLCGLLSGDPGPSRPSAALALELNGVEPADPEGRARFGERAPLVRHGLVELGGTDVLLARRLVLPQRVAGHLAGTGEPAPELVPLLVDALSVDSTCAALTADALQSGEQLVWVRNAPGGVGIAAAAAACDRLGIPPLVADLGRLPRRLAVEATSDESTRLIADPLLVRQTVRALVLEASLTGAVLVIAAAETAAAELPLLFESPLPVVAVSSVPWNAAWADELPITVNAPRLTVAAREELWTAVLGTTAPREVTALRLTPEDIARVGRHAGRHTALTRTHTTVTVDDIRHSARQLGRGRHPGRSATDETGVTVADLILAPSAAAEVGRLLDWARYRDELLAQGPLQGKGGKGTGICALFSGGPGTGKTLAAHVVADMLGIDLMQVDLSSVVSKYIGETEENLERIFAEAESLNALLFFDEADALFGSRSEIKDARDRYANQEIAYLLQRMEHFDGITVLATNLRGNLDPAFARRLHFIVTFPDPDLATRQRLWEHHLTVLPELDPHDPVDTAALAGALDITGGDIRNIVLSAAYAAIANAERVGMRHIVPAAVREYAKLGRRVPAVEFLWPAAARTSGPVATVSTADDDRTGVKLRGVR